MAITCPVNDTSGVCGTINFSVHSMSNLTMQKPEYRLKSRDGQDRSVNTFFLNENARTTNKGIPLGWIYSLNIHNNQKDKEMYANTWYLYNIWDKLFQPYS